MRVVLDSNVHIAAVKGKGRCSEVFAACAARHTLAVSELLLSEVRRALVEKMKVPAADFEEFEALIHDVAIRIEPANIEPGICRDPDDLHVLGLALAANANCIVSGDHDLLVLHPFRGIPIFTPADFQKQLL